MAASLRALVRRELSRSRSRPIAPPTSSGTKLTRSRRGNGALWWFNPSAISSISPRSIAFSTKCLIRKYREAWIGPDSDRAQSVPAASLLNREVVVVFGFWGAGRLGGRFQVQVKLCLQMEMRSVIICI